MIQRMYCVRVKSNSESNVNVFLKERYFTNREIAYGYASHLLRERKEIERLSIWVQDYEIPGKEAASNLIRAKEIFVADSMTDMKLKYIGQQYTLTFYGFRQGKPSPMAGASFETMKEALSCAFKDGLSNLGRENQKSFLEIYRVDSEKTEEGQYLFGTDNLYDIIEEMKEQNV